MTYCRGCDNTYVFFVYLSILSLLLCSRKFVVKYRSSHLFLKLWVYGEKNRAGISSNTATQLKLSKGTVLWMTWKIEIFSLNAHHRKCSHFRSFRPTGNNKRPQTRAGHSATYKNDYIILATTQDLIIAYWSLYASLYAL